MWPRAARSLRTLRIRSTIALIPKPIAYKAMAPTTIVAPGDRSMKYVSESPDMQMTTPRAMAMPIVERNERAPS